MNGKQFLLLNFFIALINSSIAQQKVYSAKEAYAIHDSINKSTWFGGGRLTHYSFLHMSEFFPTSLIYKPSKPGSFKSKSSEAIGKIQIKTDTLIMSFEDYLLKEHVNSIIIISKGNIVFEKYYSMPEEGLHTLQSVTKVITAALIARLENDGKVNLSDPVDLYIPELKATAWEGISVKHILNMRSGIEGAEGVPGDPFTDPNHAYYKFESALGLLPYGSTTPASVYDYVGTLKRKWQPGEKREYHSVNSFVLGWIGEKITGRKYADLVTEWLWQPMGAESNAYVCVSKDGVPWSHGGISSTLRDLARFGLLFTYSDIKRRKESIISFRQLNTMFEERTQTYQWGYASKKEGMSKSGFGGQGLYVHPERDIVIAYYNYSDPGWQDPTMWPEFQQVINSPIFLKLVK